MKRIRKSDLVLVISGKDKGKSGEILAVDSGKCRVKVKGVAVALKHYKARRSGEVSGIKKREAFIDWSNVMPICSSCSKPCRVGCSIVGEKKSRICGRCKQVF